MRSNFFGVFVCVLFPMYYDYYYCDFFHKAIKRWAQLGKWTLFGGIIYRGNFSNKLSAPKFDCIRTTC